jgi:hypothetical protein
MKTILITVSVLAVLSLGCNSGRGDRPDTPGTGPTGPSTPEVKDDGPYPGEVLMVAPEIRKVVTHFETGLEVKVGDVATIHRDGELIAVGRVVEEWQNEWKVQIISKTLEPQVGDKARHRPQ